MIKTILYIIVLVLMEAWAVNLIIKWRNDNIAYNLISAMVLYALVALLLAYILTNAPSVAVTNSLWQSLNIIIITVIAIIIYKERPNKYQTIGIVLAMLSVFITSYGDVVVKD